MIRKVLIVEDHESANISLQKTLEEINILHVDYVFYCDDAYKKLEKALQAGDSYDLLITDLHFEPDHYVQQITGGIALIAAVKKIQPDLKILVFSAENKPGVIDMLFKVCEIDGYVRKARHDSNELKDAISKIAENQSHIPRQLAQAMQHRHAHNFTDYDITLITLLAEGIPQKNIPFYLKQNNIQPSGLSSIEKRLNHIRETLQFNKNEQLVAFCKDMGII